MMLGVIVGNLRLIARDKASLQNVNWLFKRRSAIKNQGYSYHPDQLQPIIRRFTMLRSRQDTTSLPLFMESSLTIVGFLFLVCLL